MLSASSFCLLSGTSLSVYGNRSSTSLADESVPLDWYLIDTHHQPNITVLYHRAGFGTPIGLDDHRHAGAEMMWQSCLFFRARGRISGLLMCERMTRPDVSIDADVTPAGPWGAACYNSCEKSQL